MQPSTNQKLLKASFALALFILLFPKDILAQEPSIKKILTYNGNEDVLQFGNDFAIELDHLNFTPPLSESNKPILFLNDRPYENIVGTVNKEKSLVYFKLDHPEDQEDLDPWDVFVPTMKKKNKVEVNFAVGVKNGSSTEGNYKFDIQFFNRSKSIGWTFAFLALFTILFIVGVTHKSFLRHNPNPRIPGMKPPHSYSKVQLYYWFLIVILGYTYLLIQTGELVTLTQSTLALITISGVATFAARYKDNRDNAPEPKPNTPTPSPAYKANKGNFFSNILSDANGPTIQRVQNFAFNLIFGGYFISILLTSLKLAEFSPSQLTLIGISATAYAGLKPIESIN